MIEKTMSNYDKILYNKGRYRYNTGSTYHKKTNDFLNFIEKDINIKVR